MGGTANRDNARALNIVLFVAILAVGEPGRWAEPERALMSNSNSNRPLRHPEVRARLERSRERARIRRQQAYQREREVTNAVKRYIAAWNAIRASEARRDNEIESLNQQIETIKQRVEYEIVGHRDEQAVAAAAIREQGERENTIAELLEITTKQVRQLLNRAAISASTGNAGKGVTMDEVERSGESPASLNAVRQLPSQDGED